MFHGSNLNCCVNMHVIWQVPFCSPMRRCVRWGPLTSRAREDVAVQTLSKNMQLLIYDSAGGNIDQRFCLF